MADFQIAVALTLKNEGGYVDNPLDPGGATNMGVEQRDLPDIPIRSLTIAQATTYYAQNYWKLYYSQIAAQLIANKLFDMGVLFGVGTAVMLLQQTLAQQVTGIADDGNFGPATLQATNGYNPILLLAQYKVRLHSHEVGVGIAHPTDVIFEAGWSTRIDS